MAIIAVLLLALVGGIVLAIRSGRRTRAEFPESEGASPIAEDLSPEVDPNIGGMGLALGAAILAVVSIFLPALESSSFSHIEKNTLIQSGTGYLVADAPSELLAPSIGSTTSGRPLGRSSSWAR
jgi:hypothetical protein